MANRWWRSERSVDAGRLRFATVVRGDLERDVPLTGRTVAAFHPRLFSPARGIVRLEATPGEVVTEGTLLVQVESPELENRLAQERSMLLSLTSELGRQKIAARSSALEDAQTEDLLAVEAEAAQRAMDRAQRIFDAGLVNTTEYEKAQDGLQIARMALAHARQKSGLDTERLGFEVRQGELALERQRLIVDELERQVAGLAVRAPVDGLVSRFDVEDHDAVERGAPLATVVDLSAFEVEVAVPQSYAAEIVVGTAAEITFQSQTYGGELRSISPEVEGNTVAARLAFSGAAPPGLKQNQAVAVRLVLESRRDVLTVRRGPFLDSGGGHFAYVVAEDGIAHRRPIEVGARSVAQVEILSGVREGETLILSDTTSFAGAETVLVRR